MPAMPLHEAIRKAYRGRMKQEDLAREIQVSQPTISRWARGESEPTLGELAQIEQLCRRPRGFILRTAGFVDEDRDFEAVVASDPLLDDDGREAIIALYRYYISGQGD